jgi:hypothetical protein
LFIVSSSPPESGLRTVLDPRTSTGNYDFNFNGELLVRACPSAALRAGLRAR